MRPIALAAALATLVVGGLACEPLPPPAGYPNPATVGTPAGWAPRTVHQGDLNVTTPGTVVQDIEVAGSVNVMADGVVIRRARVHGRVWTQHRVGGGLRQFSVTVSDSVLGDPSGALDAALRGEGVVGPGRYTILRSELYGTDGFRVSGNDVVIRDNFFRATQPPCSAGYHLDGVQGYGGGQNVTVQHNTIDVRGGCGVNSAIFFADGSDSAVIVDNLLVAGGYALRVHDDNAPDVGPWIVVGNRIVSTGFGPALTTNTECGRVAWSDNHQVTIDAAYQVTSVGAAVRC